MGEVDEESKYLDIGAKFGVAILGLYDAVSGAVCDIRPFDCPITDSNVCAGAATG